MSIIAYTGAPGSGKSYAAVEHQVLTALKAGRMVVTNLALKFDLLRKDFPGCDVREFPAQAIAVQPELITDAVPPGAVLVLDEVWRIFPAGLKANQVPEQFRALFAEHRHKVDASGNSTQIVLCALDLAGISAFARQLVEQTFHVTKLSTLGIPLRGSYRVDVYAGPVAGPNPPQSGRIRQVFGKYRKQIYQYYTSHTMSEAAEDTKPNEKGMDARANIFKKPFFVVMPFLAAGVIGFIWWKGGYLLAKYRSPSASAAPAATSGASSAGPPSRPAPSVVGQALATVEGAGSWRVVGFIESAAHPERSYAMLAGAKTGAWVKVRLDRCERLPDEPVRCKYDGFWYYDNGRAEVASLANEPLRIWSAAPSSGSGAVGPVKSPEAAHVQGSSAGITSSASVDRVLSDDEVELAKLAQNRAGLDDVHRPALTYQSVAAGR